MSARRYRMSPLLRFNIKSHLERQFINNNLYFNVASGSYDTYGERADVLRRVNGKLYESWVNQWIYETDASGVSPYNASVVSGVYVNGGFHARDTAPYYPHIDYRRGRVIFGSDVPSSATVLAAYSYKHATVDYPNSEAWNLFTSQVKDNVDFSSNSMPSGLQRQLPLVVIDLQTRDMAPFALGGQNRTSEGVTFHVLTNSLHDNEQICDLLKAKTRANEYRFSSAGREDVDTRMLGSGRPFVVEIVQPRL